MSKIKTYVVHDNSYQQCLDDNGNNHYLAGFQGHTNTTVKVIVQPFQMKITNVLDKKEILTFIIGVCPDGLRHFILYY